MARDAARVCHPLFVPAFDAPARAWQPPADVYRLPDGWLLKFELAGVEPDDVAVEVATNRVTVRGVRVDRYREPACALHQLEIEYTRFERWVELPDDLDAAAVRCDFRHGMLLVRVHMGPPA